MPMRLSGRWLFPYVWVVTLLGVVSLVVMLRPGGHVIPHQTAAFWVLAVCVLLGEVRPVQVIARGVVFGTTSTTFAFALVLGTGPAAASVVLVAASIVADLIARKEWFKVMFNAAQYTLAVGISGLVIWAVSGHARLIQHGVVQVRDLGPLLLGIVAYFVVNNLLVGVVMALAQEMEILPRIRQELALQAVPDGVLLGLSPVVIVIAEGSIALVPFLIVPIAAVYISTRLSLQRQHEASHDALTGLPNRTLFRDHVQEAIDQAEGGRAVSVLLLDLDGFKDVNDTLGHQIGDLLLKQVGPRLAQEVGADDVVARLGGDEFGVLVSAAVDSSRPVTLANRLVAALADPFDIQDLKLHVDASVGVATYPNDAEDADTLMQRADVAMYVAKDERSRVELYTSERDVNSRRRLTLLGELRGAIANGELVLHYQ